MQMSIEEIKKIKKFLSLSKLKASTPIISLTVTFFPAEAGGVSGKKKLIAPRISEVIEARRKVLANELFLSQLIQLITKPATIQPIVPQTRSVENSFSGLLSCLKEIEFTKAKVGMYKIIYDNR